MKLGGESLDEIRKEVIREHGCLPRGAMWALRGNPENLKEEQRNLRDQICKEHGKIARALSIRKFLADLWNYQLREDAEQHLESVLSWCSRSRIQPFVKLGKTLRRHMDGILSGSAKRAPRSKSTTSSRDLATGSNSQETTFQGDAKPRA